MTTMAALFLGPVAWAQGSVASVQTQTSSVTELTEWIALTGDHQRKHFYVIDKAQATLHVFDHNVRWQASTPVLVGAAIGDDSVPGIGQRVLADISPAERTTPAGRFVAEGGRNHQGEQIVWVDHHSAVSMHRIRPGSTHERRAERLRTPTWADNRISYGCINVPVAFYNHYIHPRFAAQATAVVYVLPETRSLQDQFGIPPPAGK